MNCVKCGASLGEGVRFCGECGEKQPAPGAPGGPVKKTMFQGSTGKPVVSGTPVRNSEAMAKTLAGAPVPEVLAARASAAQAARTPPGQGPQPASPPARALRPQAAPAPVAGTGAPPLAPGGAHGAAVQVSPNGELDLIGKTLNNRYVVEAKIGEGGFGAVYQARQTQMNRVVALKVLHARMAKDAQVVGRFKREAQASSLLRAPHTVQVYDFDQTPEGIMYLAMEMLQGRSLHSVLHGDGPLEPVRAAKILDGLADSLGEAHGHGIVHRDIKPENVFLEPKPTADYVKVLDFGIAKIVSGEAGGGGPALTAVGQTLGTLEYMSPEQLMGLELDGRSDLYALGILAYEMLTGHLPFQAKTPGEMITGHLKTMPRPPSDVAPGQQISSLFDQIVLRLLSKNRDARYPDAASLRADLARVMQADKAGPTLVPGGVRAPANFQNPHPPTEKVEKIPVDGPPRSMILLVVVIAVAVAAIVGGVLFLTMK